MKNPHAEQHDPADHAAGRHTDIGVVFIIIPVRTADAYNYFYFYSDFFMVAFPIRPDHGLSVSSAINK